MIIFPLAAALALLAACGGAALSEASAPAAEALSAAASPAPAGAADAFIDLGGLTALPAGASYENGVLTLTAAGTYHLTGSMTGQVRVNASGPVELSLEGVSLRGRECVYILSSDPVTVVPAAGTENALSDGAAEPDKNAHAVIYSKAPLTIRGEGRLTVTAGANNGVQSRDALTVAAGAVEISAVNNGLKARGALTVSGGAVSVAAGADGLNAESSRTEEGIVRISGGAVTVSAGSDGVHAGTVHVSGGELAVTAAEDGLQAENDITVSGGSVSAVTGGGGGGAINKSGDSFGPMMQSAQTQDADVSAKGLKAGGNITVSGGVLDLNTADDSIHCGVLCTIDGGALSILSGDDAIHSDDMLVINDGDIQIADCFEGLEAFAIEVNGGNTVIRAVNDGINANGPEMMGFGPGRSTAATAAVTSVSGASVTYFRQTGGVIDLVVTGNFRNVGDGVDSNGSLYIDGGVLTVSTQGGTQEAGLDYGGGEFVITGGMVMAGGSSMMQESVSAASTQCCAVLAMTTQAAGTEVSILDEDGNGIWSVTMADAFSCLVLSHPDMTPGHVYTVTYGESSSTLDFTDTTVINSTGGFGMGFPGGPGGRPF